MLIQTMTEECRNLSGKWVILFEENVVASGDNIQELIDSAKKQYPERKLVLAQVPKEGTFIY